MKTAFLAFIALCLVLIQNSCDGDRYYRLDHRNWFVFNTGDTLLYKSTISTDTFIIDTIINEFDIVDGDNYYELLDVYFKKLNSKNYLYYSYSISRSYNSTNIAWKYLTNVISYAKNKKTEYNIENTIIKDVYEVPLDLRPTFPVRYDDDVVLAYYSDKYGIIAYKLANGLVLELDERYLVDPH